MSSTDYRNPRLKRAQAMVEFMLALPVLIALIYGVLEVSRLVFIFASAANASRQAARYGAGSGQPEGDFAYYQDCEGIRDAANRSAILAEFESINITYDRGVTPSGEQIPIPNVDPNPDADTCPIGDDIISNGDRIIVQVTVAYEPILSIINIEPLEVVSANARTFLIAVPIYGSAFPTGFKAETATPSKPVTFTPFEPFNTPIPIRTFTLQPTTNATYEAIRTAFPRTPTNTLPPTITFTPSITPTRTITASPTSTPIQCAGDFAVGHGPLVFDKNIMYMDIFNNTEHVLTTASIYVEWNHDAGGNPSLRLGQVRFAKQTWSGSLFAPSTYITSFYPFIPTGTSRIEFIFDETYTLQDGTERIIINIGNPGCTNYPVDSRH
ncbi:MAG: pilus assembly protein [Anaerolineales bacterium]|nr:pilus assembly protein [Anaerolineales bacterium]MCB9143822.1 pilus assembly protein [Anaerolineales bacterium]